jgi:hypothetical protein
LGLLLLLLLLLLEQKQQPIWPFFRVTVLFGLQLWQLLLLLRVAAMVAKTVLIHAFLRLQLKGLDPLSTWLC